MNSTLLLNADYTPVTLLPIKTIPWQDAVSFLWMDNATALHSYDDWFVRSPSVEIQVPAVMVLKNQVNPRRFGFVNHGSPRYLVFLRDDFKCQYCGEKFPAKQLTLDHVTPRAHGGETKWENLVGACAPCNGSRGEDTTIRPMTAPFRPTFKQLVSNSRKLTLTIPHPSWNLYLNWPEDKVRVVHPNNSKNLKNDFDLSDIYSLN